MLEPSMYWKINYNVELFIHTNIDVADSALPTYAPVDNVVGLSVYHPVSVV